MITRDEIETAIKTADFEHLVEIVWELRDELVTQLAMNLFAAPIEKESRKTIERLERKIAELEEANKLYRGVSHNPDDLQRITELEGALTLTLNWLSSYPGGGALNCYDKVRKVLDKNDTRRIY